MVTSCHAYGGSNLTYQPGLILTYQPGLYLLRGPQPFSVCSVVKKAYSTLQSQPK